MFSSHKISWEGKLSGFGRFKADINHKHPLHRSECAHASLSSVLVFKLKHSQQSLTELFLFLKIGSVTEKACIFLLIGS